jgi:Ser/Thr protein kinase RdoA (MazF antagonist)
VLLKAARPAPDSPGQQALADGLAEVRTLLDMVSAAAADPVLAQVPRIPIHGDYVAGNLGFRGERLSAIYDLDDSARDLRVLDLSKLLVYWCRRPDGTLDRRRFTKLFARYQRAHPLTAAEVRHFWAANIAMDLVYLLAHMSLQVSRPAHDCRWVLNMRLRPNIALLADLQKHGDPL